MYYGNLIQLSICTYQRTRESWETHGEFKLGDLNMNHVLTSILPEQNSSYIMMPYYSLTWYFFPVIIQLFPSFDPKFQ